MNASEELRRRGWQIDHQIYIADHFRATGDMVLAWAFGESKHCNVELSEWFPDDQDLAASSDCSEAPLTGWMAQREIVSLDGLNRSSGKTEAYARANVQTSVPRLIKSKGHHD